MTHAQLAHTIADEDLRAAATNLARELEATIDRAERAIATLALVQTQGMDAKVSGTWHDARFIAGNLEERGRRYSEAIGACRIARVLARKEKERS